jgi:hypothetical protein
MVLLGILITLLGFVLSVASLALTTSVNGRLILVLLGLAISLTGIFGVINRAYLKDAIWRK